MAKLDVTLTKKLVFNVKDSDKKLKECNVSKVLRVNLSRCNSNHQKFIVIAQIIEINLHGNNLIAF